MNLINILFIHIRMNGSVTKIEQLISQVAYLNVFMKYHKRPFEHNFFLQIAHSFLFMKKLIISNPEVQLNKQHRKSKNDDENLSKINSYQLT